MADQTKTDKLWTPRSVAETKKIYADWADTYEQDVTAIAYATPDRIAAALLAQQPDLGAPILDVGCGTGLSGVALARHGFTAIDGTDISPEMIAHAKAKTGPDGPLYQSSWLSDPEILSVKRAAYGTIVATGVISLGAAPPELLDELLDTLDVGGLLAFSYNDPTLADTAYTDALAAILKTGKATQVFREYGPHLNAKVTGSDVLVLRRL